MDMKSRVKYLRRQAKEFRRAGELSHDEIVHTQLLELADQCDSIATNIAKNIPTHERLRKWVHERTKK
jgi:hypothetical protein